DVGGRRPQGGGHQGRPRASPAWSPPPDRHAGPPPHARASSRGGQAAGRPRAFSHSGRGPPLEVRPKSPTGPLAPIHPTKPGFVGSPDAARLSPGHLPPHDIFDFAGTPSRRPVRIRTTWPPHASAGFPAAPLLSCQTST